MAEGNSNNSVRDRISMLVDAQERRDGVAQETVAKPIEKQNNVSQNGLAEKNNSKKEPVRISATNGKSSKKLSSILMIAIPAFAVVVVAVVLIIMKPWGSVEPGGGEIPEKDDMSYEAMQERNDRHVQATTNCGDIKREFKNGSINLEEAKKLLEEGMLVSDPTYNIYYAICYASFLHDNKDDIGGLDVLKNVESEIDDANVYVVIDYYSAMRQLYKSMNDMEKADYYFALMESMSIDEEDDEEVDLEDLYSEEKEGE